ncbi:hypothetical protein [Streptomyces sp. N35]|uniref:hypothetical protein n=1 Tax=Streptomyces sp. N35 TaxID=2795730 RepID=UPI0018F6DDB5|nr:hypothetical protein [Streptomyces sp. N35]
MELPGSSYPRQIPDQHWEIGPGWSLLLQRLHEQLSAMAGDYSVLYLKEKFGGLRLALDPVPREYAARVHELVAEAERNASATCEFCGEPGRIRTRGDRAGAWRKAVCEPCHAAWTRGDMALVAGQVRRRGDIPPRRR